MGVLILHGCFSRFLNCTNGTKSRNASYMSWSCFTLIMVLACFDLHSSDMTWISFASYLFANNNVSSFVHLICSNEIESSEEKQKCLASNLDLHFSEPITNNEKLHCNKL